jgi:hypothetical protein
MTRQTGEGKLGCLVTLALLIVFGFVCFRSIPVLIDKLDFEDQLERIASEGGARGWDPEVVRVQVADLVKNKEFLTTPEDLQVFRSAGRGGDLRINVNYWRTVDFAVYTYTFRFRAEVKSFVGAL